MKNRGFAEVALLAWVIAGLVLLFVPNPVSTSLGVGIRPNKTIQTQTQTVEPIRDANGNPVAYQTTTVITDQDIQQHITFWEWLRSLPILVLILMFAGIIFPAFGAILAKLRANAVSDYNDMKDEAKKIVLSVEAALAKIKEKDSVLAQTAKDEMAKVQDQSTKALVSQLKSQ